ncbi:hypothetical protein NHX12_031962 [Muraenolepis orangiensis]|uniref:Transmembrane protein 100 n=1 Tax=Muraenolepis orangiensis TaxID=630683 RepID=A0A9Q0E6K3_9TELE|nr:hypothetical protein NHX12_031962 [Muraenolepis orangiensis]
MPEATGKNGMKVPAAPERVPAEKLNNNNVDEDEGRAVAEAEQCRGPAAAAGHVVIPLVTEHQLTAATGGAELSCYRCTVPFGVVVLIAGVVVTAVAYSFNSHGSTICYFGLVLLSGGLVLLASSVVCWKVRLERRKERRRESQTTLVSHRRSIFGERQPPPNQQK